MSLDDFSASASSSSVGSKPYLDSWVSQWERLPVEKNFNIYYHDDYMEHPSDVYSKIGMPEMDEEQKEYFEKVKNYLLPINGRTATVDKFKYYPKKSMAVLDEISNELWKKENEESVRLRVMKFLRVLTNLMKNVGNRKKVYEGSYTKLAASFAEMCCLHAEFTFPKEDEAVWKNLYGIKEVISKPDIRLYKHGVITKPDARTSDILMSVVEVKKDSMKDPEELEIQRRRIDSTHLSVSYSSVASVDSEGIIPSIEIDLNRKVLGQHAGELLLDLYEFYKDTDVSTLTMPGMIIDGTKVFLTLLEISGSHFDKLKRNAEIDHRDKAFIYYSKPLNILQDDERSILMEVFIRLNNIEYNTKPS